METPGTELIVQTLLPIDESTGSTSTSCRAKSHLIGEINLGLMGLAEKYGVRLLDLYPHFLTARPTPFAKKSLETDCT